MRKAATEEFMMVLNHDLCVKDSFVDALVSFRVSTLNLATPEVAAVVDLE